MYLTLFVVLLALNFILIALSFYRQEHLELGIAGFLFLFALSIVIMQGQIQYKTGVNETNTYECLCCQQGELIPCYDSNVTPIITSVEKIDIYNTWEAGGLGSHWVGYILAVVSIIGLIGIFVSAGTEGFFKRRDG